MVINKMSIITVCFNSEQTIVDTLESVLQQSFSDYEYIIVDGKSTDNTMKIINQYKSKFGNNLKVVSENDKGLYDAMNKGIALASGTIIGILNSDDWYEKDTVRNVIDIFNNNDADIVTGKMNLLTSKKDLIRVCENKSIAENIYKCMPINHSATFVKKSVYSEIGGFDLRYTLSADYDFICRAYMKNKKILQRDIVLSNMRLGGKTGGCGGASGLNNGIIAAKEDFLIINQNMGKNYKFRYYKKVFVIYIRKLKRIFIPSQYD